MGVANDHSIAWGIAKALHAQGARLAFTYQGEALGRRVAPLAAKLDSDLVLPCDVEDLASVDATFEALDARFDGGLDFVVHAIGFSDKAQLKGRYVDVTTRENFVRDDDDLVLLVHRDRAARGQADDAGRVPADPDLRRGDPGHAELQRDGRGQGGAGGVRPLPRERSRSGRDPRQRAVRRPDADAGGRRDRRRAADVQSPAGPCAAAAHGEPGGCRRLSPLPPVAALGRCHRRGHISWMPATTSSRCRAGRASGPGRGRSRRRTEPHSSGMRPGGSGPRRTPRSSRTSRRTARISSAEGGADG